MTGGAAPDAAAAFVKFMAAPENRDVWKEAGFEPPHDSPSRSPSPASPAARPSRCSTGSARCTRSAAGNKLNALLRQHERHRRAGGGARGARCAADADGDDRGLCRARRRRRAPARRSPISGSPSASPPGHPVPNVSTPEALRAALLAAGSIVHAPPTATPSGAQSDKVIKQLGLAEQARRPGNAQSRPRRRAWRP